MAQVIPAYRRGRVGYGRPYVGYRRFYEDVPTGAAALSQPKRRAVTLRFYDREDVLVGVVSSNAQRQLLLAANWEILDTGCGQFEVELALNLNLGHDYRCDIHLWNDPAPIYSGLILRRPSPGSTDRTWTYGGSGFGALLGRIVLTASYGSQTVQGIVYDLMRKVQLRFPRIGSSALKIDPILYNTSGALDFLRMPIADCFEQAAQLAGGYTWGVDADRQLFFRSPSQEVEMHRWAGKHLDTFIPQEESDEIVNTVFIRSGKVRSDLPSDNPYYKTNWLEDFIKDDVSIATWGVREGIFSAPSVLGQVDAQIAAKNWLQTKKRPRQYASVRGLVYNGERLNCNGSARIVGDDGAELILPKKKLKFSLKPTGVDVSLELGDLDYSNSQILARLAAVTAAENLARQQSQKQL